MESQIDRAMRRTWRYWYEDGLAEMALGCMFVALGLSFFVESVLPQGPWRAAWGMLAPLTAVVGTALLGNRAVKAVKARITYPRTGYVAYRRERRGRNWATRITLGFAVGALVGALAALPSLKVWVPAISGLIMGGVWTYLGQRLDLPRFYLLAAAAAILGTLVSLGGFDDLSAGALYYAGFGVLVVVWGSATLCAYLRSTQPPTEVEDCGR